MLFSTAPSVASTVPIRNRLLAILAPCDLARLRPYLEPVALGLGEAPTEPGRPVGHVLFPEAGIVSLLAVAPDKRRRIEAGMVGREGMVGLPVVLGAAAELHETVVQADMQGWRLPSNALRRAGSGGGRVLRSAGSRVRPLVRPGALIHRKRACKCLSPAHIG